MIKNLKNLPSTIGVYIFKTARGEILYIGKSVNIKARIKSHFENAKLDLKERAIITGADKIETIATESEFKALILESSLIQKHRPKYNKIWMDDKSYLYVRIAMSEEYPKISLLRRSDIDQRKFEIRNSKFEIKSENSNKLKFKERKSVNLFFGPFSSRRALENLLREIRRVIPFCSAKKITKSPCFYSKIGLCEPCPNHIFKLEQDFLNERRDFYGFRADKNGLEQKKIRKNPSEIRINQIGELKKEYRNNIKEIIKIFEGKTDIVLKDLRKELTSLSKEEKYEEAIAMRNRIGRFERLISERGFEDNMNYESGIMNQELINENMFKILTPYFPNLYDIHRIECYDVSNLNFKEVTAAMTVAVDGSIDKSQYRKFKILTNTIKYYPILTNTNKKGNVDWKLMYSVFLRRFKHPEWENPDLLVVDGGKPQVRMAVECMRELKLKIPVVGIAKNPDRLVIGVENMPTIRPELNNSGFNLIRLLRDEAHRFGRKYHLFLREKKIFIS